MRWKLHVRFGERAGETDQQETLTPRPGPTQPDLAQHKAAIAKYVYPPVKVVLEWVPTSDTHGLLAIIVPPHDVGQRPFLLTINVDRGDTIVQMFSLPVRDGAATAFEPPGLIWRDISDGRRARAEPSRLSSRPSIEGSTPSAIGSDWARDRFEVAIEEIEAFMGWGSSESVFALAAAPGSPGRYAPRDFRAVDGLAGAMRDLNSPRYAGFGLTYGESPEQVGSALVVNSARQRYVRVEPTGLAVAATATSGDFLTWASRTRFAESAPLTINAVVVVEYTYLFCRFTFEQLQSRFEGQWEFCITLRRAQSATAPLRMKDHWPNGFEQYKSMSDVLMEWIPAEETAEKTALQLVSRLWDFYSLPRDSVPLTVDSEIDTAALFAQG